MTNLAANEAAISNFWSRNEACRMGSDIRNRLTFGDFSGKMVDEVPETYLKLLAKSLWVKNNEPEIYEEAKRLCRARGLVLIEPRIQAESNEELRGAMLILVTGVYKQMALKYHPDRNQTETARDQMSALNDCIDLLRKAIESYFDETKGK